MTKVFKSFLYTTDESWHQSLKDTAGLAASLKQDKVDSVKYWEFQATDGEGKFVGEPLVAFSVDAVPGSKNPDPEVIASEHFIKHFMNYTKNGGIDYAVKRYRAIPRVRDVSFTEMLGLSPEEVEKIRSGIAGRAEDFSDLSEFTDVAEKAVNRVLDMLSSDEQKIPEGPIETEERVDETGMRSFYIKGTKLLHRDGGPAAIGSNGSEMWMQKGQLHRVGGPAIKFPDGGEAYWQDGKLHRTDGPAIKDASGEEAYAIHGLMITKEVFESATRQGLVPDASEGSVSWTKDGHPHNAEGPAIFTSNAQYWAINGLLHNEDGPAVVYNDGKVGFFLHGFAFKAEDFAAIKEAELAVEFMEISKEASKDINHHAIIFRNDVGQIHRDDGPAVMYSNGARAWKINDLPHNLNGPAFIHSDGREQWFINGFEFNYDDYQSIVAQGLDSALVSGNIQFYKPGTAILHRERGPAIIYANGTQSWYYSGHLHREDGPAIEYQDGSRDWYQEGLLSRAGAPAVERPDGHVEYWVDGDRHNPLGPAVIRADGRREYWVSGVSLTLEEFEHTLEQELEVEALSNGDIVFSLESTSDYHRVGGPAVKRANGTKEWFVNGLRHNEEGPAIVRTDGTESYYLGDRVVTKEQHRYWMEHGDGVAIDGLVLKQHDDGSIEWTPAPENPEFVMHIKPLEAKTSLDMRASEDILLQGDDVMFETKSGNTSISEIQEALNDLAEHVKKMETPQTKDLPDIGVEGDVHGEMLDGLDLDSFLKAAEEVMTDSLSLAVRAARAELIANEPGLVIDYAKHLRNLSDGDRERVLRSIEEAEGKKLVNEFLEEEEVEKSVEDKHAERRRAHLDEILTPPDGIEAEAVSNDDEEESMGLLPTLAGAALVALAGAVVSGKKSTKKIKEKKKVEEEQAAVYN